MDESEILRIRLVAADDTPATAKKLEQTLADAYRIVRIEKSSSFLWFLHLPVEYEWTMKDTDFMNSLMERHNLLAGWRKVR